MYIFFGFKGKTKEYQVFAYLTKNIKDKKVVHCKAIETKYDHHH